MSFPHHRLCEAAKELYLHGAGAELFEADDALVTLARVMACLPEILVPLANYHTFTPAQSARLHSAFHVWCRVRDVAELRLMPFATAIHLVSQVESC